MTATSTHHRERSRSGIGPSVAAAQALVYVSTGVWPLVHMESFIAVTGPKTDLWLVQTVGSLIAVIGIVLAAAVWNGRITFESGVLGMASAACLAAVDIIFVSRGTIPPVYLVDAALELAFVVGWCVAAFQHRRIPSR
jgi:ABC-type cobalamin transport system permease subunit